MSVLSSSADPASCSSAMCCHLVFNLVNTVNKHRYNKIIKYSKGIESELLILCNDLIKINDNQTIMANYTVCTVIYYCKKEKINYTVTNNML